MPEGLKLVVGADITEAEKALQTLTKDAGTTTNAIDRLGKSKGFTQLSNTAVTATGALKKLKPASNEATASLINLGRVAQDAPFGIIGIANNINPLLESFQRLRASSATTGAALKSLAGSLIGGGGLGLAVSVVTGLMSYFALSSRGAKKETDELKGSTDEAAKKQQEFASAVQAASQYVIGQAKDLAELRTVLIDITKGTNDLTKATINLGIARLLFDSKSKAIQEALNAEIEREFILRKRANSGLNQNAEFKVDPQLLQLQQLRASIFGKASTAGLDADIKRLQELNGVIGGSGGTTRLLNEMSKGLESAFAGFVDGKGKDPKKAADNIIAEAKRVADYFNDRSIRNVGIEFSPFEKDEAANKVKARAFVKKFQSDFRSAIKEFGFDLDIAPNVGIDTSGSEFKRNVEVQGQKAILALQEAISKLKKSKILIDFDLDLDTQRKRGEEFAQKLGVNFQNLNSLLTDAQKNTVFFANTISNTLGSAFQSLSQAIISGENPIKAFFQSIGQSVVQLIQKLLQAAIQAAILNAIFGAAGFTSGGNTIKGFGGFFKNLVGFAAGGIVSGPTLAMVGEGRGTSRSNPEIIAPLDQLRGMIQGMGGGAPMTGRLSARIRGTDLLLSNARTSRSQRRLGAG